MTDEALFPRSGICPQIAGLLVRLVMSPLCVSLAMRVLMSLSSARGWVSSPSMLFGKSLLKVMISCVSTFCSIDGVVMRIGTSVVPDKVITARGGVVERKAGAVINRCSVVGRDCVVGRIGSVDRGKVGSLSIMVVCLKFLALACITLFEFTSSSSEGSMMFELSKSRMMSAAVIRSQRPFHLV